MKAHRIRLAGPWEVRQLDNQLQPDGDLANCKLPYTVLPSLDSVAVLLLRGFHRPTGIGENTVLRIILKANQPPHEVFINNTPAEFCETNPRDTTNLNDTHCEYSIDISHSIAAFNQFGVSFLVRNTEPPATLETAWLEIQD